MPDLDVGAARAADLQAHTELLKIEIARRNGQLIDKEFAAKQVQDFTAQMRDGWLAWAARVAPRMAATFDCSEVDAFTWLDREIRQQLINSAASIQLDEPARNGAADSSSLEGGLSAGSANPRVRMGRSTSNSDKPRQRRARKVAN